MRIIAMKPVQVYMFYTQSGKTIVQFFCEMRSVDATLAGL